VTRRLGLGCAIGCAGPLVAFIILCGAVGILAGSCAVAAGPSVPAPAAISGIPPDYLVLYEQAGERFGLQWQILAGIGRVETDHGQDGVGCTPNRAGAQGPMQFLPATFAEAVRLAGIADPDICDPADAIPAAAALLAHDGAPANWHAALLAYNPNPAYPDEVMTWANRYAMAVQVIWPLRGNVTQGFGPTSFTLEPPLVYEGKYYPHFHPGIDIAAPLGTPVRAFAAGQVVFAGKDSSGAVVVEIEHLPNVISLYGHLEDPPAVKVGDIVVTGQVVGDVGLTGNTTGPHLHFGIYEAGVPVDPMTVLPPRS
jgi:murein DD-endopeptidase MepM/ murein hydrolase activator NlpD